MTSYPLRVVAFSRPGLFAVPRTLSAAGASSRSEPMRTCPGRDCESAHCGYCGRAFPVDTLARDCERAHEQEPSTPATSREVDP